jgi:hypothetical protein
MYRHAGEPLPDARSRRPVAPAPAPSPRAAALLRIQQTAGNRAAVAIVQEARGPLLQRVGEKKLSFVGEQGADEAELSLLRAAIVGLGVSDEKTAFEDKTLAHMGKEKTAEAVRARQKIVMQDYVKVLDTGDSLKRLGETKAFADGLLKLGKADAGNDFIEVLGKGDKVIAHLSVGEASYIPDLLGEGEEPKSERVTLTKLDKPLQQYVEDDRRVATRRYAYCEKSFYQFMELVATEMMSGRYQILQYALREAPMTLAVTPGLGMALGRDPGQPLQSLGVEQLAVLHQWMGSGMQQRGLSLTSTPRERAVFANEGLSFREPDGVRLKIDLFRVPKEVMLINHYASGGVKDETSTVNPGLVRNQPSDARRAKYGYVHSVLKNRELYLEYLDPDWIVGIDAHGLPPKNTPTVTQGSITTQPTPPAEGRQLLAQVGQEVGFPEYAKGFGAAVEAIRDSLPPPDTSTSPDSPFAKGVGSGRMYMEGFVAGGSERAALVNAVTTAMATIRVSYDTGASRKTVEQRLQSARGKASSLKVKKPTTVAELGTNLVCDIVAEQDMAAMERIEPTGWLALTTIAKDRDKKAIYWVGWAHAARGEPPHHRMDQGFY